MSLFYPPQEQNNFLFSSLCTYLPTPKRRPYAFVILPLPLSLPLAWATAVNGL